MSTLPLISTAQPVALTALLILAVVTDLRLRQVPNALVLAGLGLALTSHIGAVASGATALAGTAWWAPLAGLSVGCALLLPLYLLRAMGAGDVKLLAMVGAFVGPGAVFSAFVYTLLAGGLLSLLFLLGRSVAARTFSNLRFMFTDWRGRASTGGGLRPAPLATTAARLPYAVAITLGTVAALGWPLLGR